MKTTTLLALLLLAGCNSLLGISDPTLVEPGTPDARVGPGTPDAALPAPDGRADARGPADDAPPPDADVTPDAAPPITGTAHAYRHVTSGEVTDPSGLVLYGISAARLDESGFSPFAFGSWDEEGRFVIPDVPQGGQVYLRRLCSYCLPEEAVTSVRQGLDLGLDVLGRRLVGTLEARILLTGAGLDPWTPGNHSLVLVVPNIVHELHMSGLSVGVSEVDGFVVPWQPGIPAGAALGDRFTFLQTEFYSSGNTFGRRITKAFSRTDLDLVAGDNAVSGAFVTPANRQLYLDWRRAEYEVFKGELCPGDTLMQPYHTVRVVFSPVPEMFFRVNGFHVFSAQTTDATNENLGTVLIRDPLGAGRPRIRVSELAAYCAFPVGENPTYFDVTIQTTVDLTSITPSAPLVSPPQSPRVDGKSGRVEQTIGLTPLIEWSPPAHGTADRYQVAVWHLHPEFGASLHRFYHLPAAPAPKLRIPPDLLEAGHTYLFKISAIVSPGDAERAPFRFGLPFGKADTFTAAMTVGP